MGHIVHLHFRPSTSCTRKAHNWMEKICSVRNGICIRLFEVIISINFLKKFQALESKYWNCKKNITFSKSHCLILSINLWIWICHDGFNPRTIRIKPIMREWNIHYTPWLVESFSLAIPKEKTMIIKSTWLVSQPFRDCHGITPISQVNIRIVKN